MVYKNIRSIKKPQDWEYKDYLKRLQTARTAADQKIDTNFNRAVDDDYNKSKQWDEGERSKY